MTTLENLNQKLEFVRTSLKSLKSTGSVARSSSSLCKAMTEPINFTEAKLIIELGAGDGVITQYILDKMGEDCKLFVFEINKDFLEILKSKFHDPRITIISDSAEFLTSILEREQINEVDYVISAIPFMLLPEAIVIQIVESCKESLKLNGKFIQMHYSLMMRRVYSEIFGNLSIKFVPFNIPPAFVLVSSKQ